MTESYREHPEKFYFTVYGDDPDGKTQKLLFEGPGPIPQDVMDQVGFPKVHFSVRPLGEAYVPSETFDPVPTWEEVRAAAAKANELLVRKLKATGDDR